MPKVLFEIDLSHTYDVDGPADFLADLLSKYMLDFNTYSSVGISKEARLAHIGQYSLTEFMDDCDDVEKKRLIYKMLLERMYHFTMGVKVLFLAELDCFRPGYIAHIDAEEFTNFFYKCIKDLFSKVQEFVKQQVTKIDISVRTDVRSFYRIQEFSEINIRDLTFVEMLEMQETALV